LVGNLTNITQSLPIVSGSNPNLISETSDSYTYGVVIRPSFVPGLTVSVDYYDITVNNVIANINVQTLVNQCYDSATLNNIFCGQFSRWRGPGNGPLGEVPGRILGNSLINAPVNFASRVRRGIDTNVGYTQTFGKVKFNADLIYTHSLENSNFQDPTNPTFETRLLKQIGDPKDEFRLDLDFNYEAFSFGYRLRYIGPMYYNTYPTLFPLNGLPASDVDAFPTTQIPSVMYHDVRFDFKVDRSETAGELLFYFGIDNLLDKGVPQGAATATGAGTAIYNFAGRSYYAGVRARF
jgi:outer membrane cobalamin receptor